MTQTDIHPERGDRYLDTAIDRTLLERLRKLIGRDCIYLRKPCVVVDLLVEEALLILEVSESMPPIQTDQFGQANFRANELLQVPVLNSDRSGFSEDILDLFASLTDA